MAEKTTPPPGAYPLGEQEERVQQARKYAALSGRGKMLSNRSPRNRKSMLTSSKVWETLTSTRRASPGHKDAPPPSHTPATSHGRASPGRRANGHAPLPTSPGGAKGLSRAESRLLAPPRELNGGGGGAAADAGAIYKQRPEDEGRGPTDEDERLAVARRRSPEWGAGVAAGALTDPSRFSAAYTIRETVRDEYGLPVPPGSAASHHSGSQTYSAAWSYWDSARGSASGDQEALAEERLRNLRSQRRRVWMHSSRRWVEARERKEPPTAAERKAARQRLGRTAPHYSARPRVYE